MAAVGCVFRLCRCDSLSYPPVVQQSTWVRPRNNRIGLSASWGKPRRRSFTFYVNAIFWRNTQRRHLVEPQERDFLISTEQIIDPMIERTSNGGDASRKISISVVSSISQVSSEDWDACAIGATGHTKLNPFLTHAFLQSLEDTGCAVQETGWLPQHITATDQDGIVLGVVPLYVKSHSYGEYVFDHSWADAYYRFGSSYYPKLQCCVPFTPVTGQRILVRDTCYKDQIFDKLLIALKLLTDKLQVSSLHITFPTKEEWEKVSQFGFLQRIGMQYHWKNRDYKSFDDFLMDLKQSKRKTIRQERKKILASNLRMRRLRGYEIKAHHWDSFYRFYCNTTDNKWGRAYLTREFFHMIGSKLGDRVLLVVAEDGEKPVAGALNLIGGDCLFGRLWGCLSEAYYPNLHFEACYYQAIEAAIEWNLSTVEAGAQGEHKVQRGYMPVTTYSCHYIPDKSFKQAISDFLTRETPQVNLVTQLLADSGPFKDGVL